MPGHMTDHSFKKGVPQLLAPEIARKTLPQSILAQILKHKSGTEEVPTVTSTYCDRFTLSCILQAKGVMDAAVILRRTIMRDL